MWFGQAGFFNVTVAIAAALAWLTGTNHCLLGLRTQPQSRAVSACPRSEASKRSGACRGIPSRMLGCCQGLLSANSEPTQAKVKFSPVLMEPQFLAVGNLVPFQAPQSTIPSTEYDTGPPAGNCFVGTVLRRSLRENAPPLIA